MLQYKQLKSLCLSIFEIITFCFYVMDKTFFIIIQFVYKITTFQYLLMLTLIEFIRKKFKKYTVDYNVL